MDTEIAGALFYLKRRAADLYPLYLVHRDKIMLQRQPSESAERNAAPAQTYSCIAVGIYPEQQPPY